MKCSKQYMARVAKWQANNPEKVREYKRRWSEKNRDYFAEWRKANHAHVLAMDSAYRKSTHGKAVRARWAKGRPPRREYQNRYQRKLREDLSRDYIIALILQDSILRAADIPPALVEAKRAELKLKRALKGIRHGKEHLCEAEYAS